MTEQKIIIVRERFVEGVARDATTFATFCAMIGLGVWLESGAMQWIGALMFMMSLISKMAGFRKESTYTLDEAAAKIAEWQKDAAMSRARGEG